MRPTLTDIFGTNSHSYDDVHRFFERKIDDLTRQPALIYGSRGATGLIDLQGRAFILDRPLNLKNLQLVTICNGSLIGGPTFPLDEFLIRVSNAHGLRFVNLFLECSKRANGIQLENFLRIRIEDCYLVHQRSYGIYSSREGGNHELEVVKCHISEFLFGDGYPGKKVNYGVIPEYDIDANRVSTGIFLGQADNVVADCNINLCRVGIFSGMRANRIQGNHITGGGSKELELYKGIELNAFHKSSAMIVNNYIDNCCLWINCTNDPKTNLRNYIHVTDNLFYRGYNHPRAGGEFNHIVVNPLAPDSLLSNLHICDNLFYSQPENLEGIKPRIITPIRVKQCEGDVGMHSIDHEHLIGVTMANNHFTNCYPTFVTPMGSTVTKIIDVHPDKQQYEVSFDEEIPLGYIRSAVVSVIEYAGQVLPMCKIRRIHKRRVVVDVIAKNDARLAVTGSADTTYSQRYNYTVR